LLNRPSISEQAGAVDPHWVGRRGEAIAACWLWTQGCRILYRNYRGPEGGEVDLVCRHGQDLCFAEVKTRTGTAFGRPGLAVDEAKQRLIRRGAESWLRLLGCPEIRWRYDIVELREKLCADGRERIGSLHIFGECLVFGGSRILAEDSILALCLRNLISSQDESFN
jgi:putative endonuclease